MSGITAYTMEGIDQLGMRKVMLEALGRITRETEGLTPLLGTDVINADDEGLTFRAGHPAMIADSSLMRVPDISGPPIKAGSTTVPCPRLRSRPLPKESF